MSRRKIVIESEGRVFLGCVRSNRWSGYGGGAIGGSGAGVGEGRIMKFVSP
jgi:hypothetical protein